VHASASPFEALAERLNWLGANLEDDGFGKAMLSSGIPKETIMHWTKDPQVPFEGNKGASRAAPSHARTHARGVYTHARTL